MAHQCVNCKAEFEDGSRTLLAGCQKCGGKFFFFYKKSELRDEIENLTPSQVKEIEEDVREMVGPTNNDPVVLDFESVRIMGPGKFEIDLANLFKREPVVYKVRDGKYIIDIPSTFQMLSKKKAKGKN